MARQKRRWLITGVSSGLGRALMEAVIVHGDDVVGTVQRLPDNAQPPGKGPGRGRYVMLDVTRSDMIAPAMATAAEWLGGIDVLVNNAGIGTFGAVEACSIDDYRRSMEVNYFGVVAVTKAAFPYLRASRGTLFNVASMAAFVAMGGTSAYTVSKHAILGLTEALREELAPFGVRVIASLPGGFRTEFWSTRSNTIRDGLGEVYGRHPAGQIRQRSQAHAGHELGDPDRLAQLVIRLVEHEDPPLYLVAGADALDYVETKRRRMAAELETQYAIGTSTAFD